MNKLIMIFVCFLLAGCASTPRYEKMPTLEEKVSSDEDIKPGMAITKHGAVIDITVEEVQAQKARLEKENTELKAKLKALQADLDQERMKVTVLKMSANPSRNPASEDQN